MGESQEEVSGKLSLGGNMKEKVWHGEQLRYSREVKIVSLVPTNEMGDSQFLPPCHCLAFCSHDPHLTPL